MLSTAILSGIRCSLVGIAIVVVAAASMSTVYITRGRETNNGHNEVTGKRDNRLSVIEEGIRMENDGAFCHQLETIGPGSSSNCPDIQVTLLDVLQNQVFVGKDRQLSCLGLDDIWSEIVDAPRFRGMYNDGEEQAKTFEELVSFNYGETFLISAWEYSNLSAIYGKRFARITFDLTITTACQDESGMNHEHFHERAQFLAYCHGDEGKITELHLTYNEEHPFSLLNQVSDGDDCVEATKLAWNGTFPPPTSICYHR